MGFPTSGLGPGLRVFGAPHRYVQGPGALDHLGDVVATLGPVALVVVDAGVADLVGPRCEAALLSAGVAAHRHDLTSEVTHAAIDALVARAAALVGAPGPAVVVGVGGGKTLDLARALATRRAEPFVAVPTITSNDSPAAMAVAIYDDHHEMVEVEQTGRNPDVVLVDTALVAGAPVRLLAAGIGDAVAKYFEARSCAAAAGLNQHGTRGLRTALGVAELCWRTLRACAAGAVSAVERGAVDEALEDTVEATVLMSGLAFENGGLSIAHSLVRGLQAVRGASSALHGEQVAYGLLVQLALEGAPELDDVAHLLESVGLPTRLADLGLLEPTTAELAVVVGRCAASPHSRKTPARVDEERLLQAVAQVEARAAGTPGSSPSTHGQEVRKAGAGPR